MGDRHFWNQISTNVLGGEISVTNFTCSTTCTGLVASPGTRLQIFGVMISAPDLSNAEGIGDSILQDGG